jgi:plasmid maintenance system antidote protein VapI
MHDNGVEFKDIAKSLSVGIPEARSIVRGDSEITWRTLVRILDLCGAEPYLVLRPQKAWVER